MRVTSRPRLAVEVLRTAVTARRAIAGDDLPAALRRVRDDVLARPPIPTVDDPARLGRAVRRTLRYVPSRSRCLVESLVLASMLARRGVRVDVVIGVRPGSDFGAHAWVELDGTALLPHDEAQFGRLVAL